MTEEFSDSRPRRRLFGRRRPDEELIERPASVSAQSAWVRDDESPSASGSDAGDVAPNVGQAATNGDTASSSDDEPTDAPAVTPPTVPMVPTVPTPPAIGEAPNHTPPLPAESPIAEVEQGGGDRPLASDRAPDPAPNDGPVAAASAPERGSAPQPADSARPQRADLPGIEALDGPGAEALGDLEAEVGDTPLELPRIIAIANQKGGVGKTTTAVNLGAALAESGLRVLVVDLDPQGNASTGLGINPRDVNASIYDVLMHETPALDAVEPTSLKNLFVIPATLDLAGAEIELVPAFSRELKLKRALDAVRSEYDVVLIDCPPSLGLLTVNGLAAADDVLVPIQCEYYALEGLGQLLRNVALVRSSLNATLDVRGIILTMYDARTRLAEQVETEVREHFGEKVYKTVVPRTVRLAEAPSFGQPVIVFDPTSRGAKAYRKLAKEVSSGATRRTG